MPLKNLYYILDRSDIDGKYVAAIERMCKDLETRMKVGKRLSAVVRPTKGLRLGCCLSPTLFDVYVNDILKEWQNICSGMGLNINETFLQASLFADDQILMAADEYDIEYMMRTISENYDRAGLKVNFAKTKYLVVGD